MQPLRDLYLKDIEIKYRIKKVKGDKVIGQKVTCPIIGMDSYFSFADKGLLKDL